MTNKIAKRSLRILVAGGGVAGQALAFWLTRGGHAVTVVERSPALRASGAQVDLRGQGIEAVERMGLLREVRSRLVDEAGVAFVDSCGKPRATIMANTSGKGRQSLTSEYEIMRGDLVRILHNATRDDAEHVFGMSVDGFDQHSERVTAHFSDGTSGEYDLLIGADGQGSRTRRALLPPGSDPYWRVGIHMAYWFAPRIASDTNIRDTYMVPGGRQIMRRSHNATETQVYFVMREESAEASAIHRAPVEQQQAFWAERFKDAGWQTERSVTGMKDSPFFYSQEIAQVRIDNWSKGRVVLAGDAAHCASPYSGMGISGGLVGAYVLAGRSTGTRPTCRPRWRTTNRSCGPSSTRSRERSTPASCAWACPSVSTPSARSRASPRWPASCASPTWSPACRGRTAAATGSSRPSPTRTPPERRAESTLRS
ncbi:MULTISPECIES: FAD-dependent monooxygenase [unclassified Streptomyces]|uniref:FAD-dependent monooxygenase n=1 Tax=unclassified Streptomyces TaxID=2593676 RepID=UPI001F229F4A|nr:MULTISPECIES: FAD-dependent monooxygenase [unclassified Streptomyces]